MLVWAGTPFQGFCASEVGSRGGAPGWIGSPRWGFGWFEPTFKPGVLPATS
jgi:hypothetical protein